MSQEDDLREFHAALAILSEIDDIEDTDWSYFLPAIHTVEDFLRRYQK